LGLCMADPADSDRLVDCNEEKAVGNGKE
jgi:hypothetical protein